jgi:HIV Tat-specific factor 1
MFWGPGLGEWKALKDLPQLQVLLRRSTAAAVAARAPAATAPARLVGRVAAGALSASTGQTASAPLGQQPDEELAGFFAEISAIEAEVEGGEEDMGKRESPPPDERSFEDDDGTVYLWNPSLRKFMPVEEEAGPYTEDEMVFVPEEEKMPEYKPPISSDDQDEERVPGEAVDMGRRAEEEEGGTANTVIKSKAGKKGEMGISAAAGKRGTKEAALEEVRMGVFMQVMGLSVCNEVYGDQRGQHMCHFSFLHRHAHKYTHRTQMSSCRCARR